MKIKPELLLTKDQDIFIYNKILVTGLDTTLINYITGFFVNEFKDKNFHIDTSGEINVNQTGNLFSENKTLFLLKENIGKLDYNDNLLQEDQFLIISSSNSNKINKIKSEYIKSKHCLVVECYNLSRIAKKTILSDFVEKKAMHLSSDVFWYVIENFNDEYVLLLNQLTSLSLFGKRFESVKDIEGVVGLENKIEINKIFFCILGDNKTLVDLYKHNILSQGDFYILLNSLKLYLEMISSSLNKDEVLAKFPKYLFNEKGNFIKIYNLLDYKKILLLYKNIFKAEGLIRKNPNLYLDVGMRFLLNTKKIITS